MIKFTKDLHLEKYPTYNITKNLILFSRKSWDQCIVPFDHPFGSSIPIGWVIPKINPSEKWATYRKDATATETLTKDIGMEMEGMIDASDN